MQLATVLVLLVVCSHCALCAPTTGHQDVADKQETHPKEVPNDVLELQLQRVDPPQEIALDGIHENEAPVHNEAVDLGGPVEVKRQERVDTDGDDVNEYGDLTGLSGNLKAADQDVKEVLRTFFLNLKRHPEIVEEIIEKEGEKLMAGPLEVKSDNSEADEGDSAIDLSVFQQPSPQLTQIPKQMEKKTGGFPDQPRYIYKSPMLDVEQLNQIAAKGPESMARRVQDNQVAAQNAFAEHHDNDKNDIDNAIPVIQQPSQNIHLDPQQAEALSIVPEGGDDLDLQNLQQAQEEYSRDHPFINTLPIFSGPESKDNQDVIKTENKDFLEAEDLDNAQTVKDGPSEKDTEIVNSKSVPDAADDSESQVAELEELQDKRAGDDQDEGETDAGTWSEEEDDHGQDSDTADAGAAVAGTEHKQTSDEIIAEALNHPLASEAGDKPYQGRPYYYYYYYNEDGNANENKELDASEEGEQEEEDDLENISSENSDESNDDQGDVEEEEDEDEEKQNEDVHPEEEEEVSNTDEDTDDMDETDTETEADAEGEGEETEEDDNDVVDEDEEETDTDEGADVGEKSDSGKTNSNHVVETINMPDPSGKARVFRPEGLLEDSNEEDLQSLSKPSNQRLSPQAPDVGQPM